MVNCGVCMYWETTDKHRGKCCFNPPAVTLIPQQGIGGAGLAAVTYWPETSSENACGQGDDGGYDPETGTVLVGNG